MRYPALAVILLVSSGCAKQEGNQQPARAETPEGAVGSFYEWRIRSRMTGVPTSAQLASMEPYISKKLYALLARARTGYAEFAQGDLFSSLFDGPTSFTTGEVESHANGEHIVPVRFVSGKQLPAVNWVDRVKVVQENGAYVIADIEYGNHWDLGSNGTLTEALRRGTRRRA